MNLKEVLTQNKGSIVDVRTPGEFMGGNVANSINIPLQEIPSRLEELKNMELPLVFCCASGGRSGMAAQILSQQGVSCLNGGSWMDVNYIVNQNS